jgi:hypothetical protein
MSENTVSRPASQLARLSFRLGMLALLMPALTGGLIAGRVADSRLQVLTQGDRRLAEQQASALRTLVPRKDC